VVTPLKKLAIITSHPIQYNAPLFRLLASRNKIKIKVFYTWSQAIDKAEDRGFGRTIKWDIPLLDGYDYQVVKNISKTPGTHHRKGIINPSLICEIQKWQPNAMLVYGWNFVSHFQVMKYFKGKIPVLFRGDSTLLDESKSIKTIVRSLYLKHVYKHIDYALYVGTNNKKYFQKNGLTKKQLIFTPHAIDNDRFSDSSERQYNVTRESIDSSKLDGKYKTQSENMASCSKDRLACKAMEWRRELGYTDADIVVLFAGKFEPKKNPEMLVEAVNQITKSPNRQITKLLMVGNGILEGKLKAMSKDNERIKFLPFQNQTKMPTLYRVCDIYCLPSRGPEETWGLAVNEAMASGRSVLLSDKVGCGIDLVKTDFNGWMFRHDNIHNLKNKLEELITSKEHLIQMGKDAEEFIKKWSFERICKAIESLMKKI
jgi:glycosyltransferase involved in cell wall biosynthesis